ncbi:uncharacterized protein Z519_00162 [Cladophialophora bantiana CBS 173.52]|uniref:Uncharacterized protein n=1 Tax=Cladophialophora bantiana (strain ATCC 10958 / CBS 173.52 / CDC B-1940 / NIH 8579) TaxID=1442370 RepID=A0A0D2F8Y0_CLAB1|nr:uncharacterized protein Z519_00162 [Cladophialophora bantiana CBS 173.52]KIW98501.1 hypothetical protein Z519_00162 [Cladophialophora bantiana CBS 173.52]
MPPITRKKAQAMNNKNNPQPFSAVTDGAAQAAGDVMDHKHKDDDPFERVFGPIIDVLSDDRDSDYSDYGADKKKRKRKSDSGQKGKAKKRRGRAPPPVVPDLSDDDYVSNGVESEREEDSGLWSVERSAAAKKSQEKNELSQVLSVKVNGEGGAKTIINLNLADVLKDLGATSWTLPVATRADTGDFEDTTLVESKKSKKFGFCELPFELRLKVYRFVFRQGKATEFENRDFSRSSHFLRTNKQVLKEGRAVLYGENSFHFTRDTAIRGKYYQKVWREVGFKDIRRFLESIGPVNISCFKYISFVLTDGADGRSRTASQIPERKFVDDPHLHEVFRLIGANATLRTLAIQFAGRAWVTHNDFHFLKALTEIKCYNFVTIYRLRGLTNKILNDLKGKLKLVMRVTEDGVPVERKDNKNKVKMVYDGFSVYPGMVHWASEW